MSSWTLYGQSDTKNTVEISVSQVSELYKIAKQNDFLKDLAKKQEKELFNANTLIKDQKRSLDKYSQLSKEKDNLLQQKQFEMTKMLESKDVEIKMLQDISKANEKIMKRTARRKFWRGFGIGGVTVGIIGTGTAIYFLTK